MGNFEEHYAKCYDLLYRTKDYEKEADYVLGLLRESSPNARSILDLGCGTGRYDEVFLARGYSVFGVDRSEAMLERAKDRCGDRMEYARSDIVGLELGRRFDAVTALFHVVDYVTTNQRLGALFAGIGRHLAEGGTLIFDFWYGPAVLTDP